MLKWLVIGWLLVAFVVTSKAQSTQIIHGKIVSKKTGEPVGFAGIHIPESDFWTSSDMAGTFVIQPQGIPVVTLEISCLGFETYSEKFLGSSIDPDLEIKMVPISYDMPEVTVLAKNNNGITSSSLLESAAIEHVQPGSLADVLQLLPGNLSTNPDFSVAQKMSMREIGDDNNSAMGTAILMDGAPVSNNANLQTFSTLKSDNSFITTAGSGIDLRQFSTDNIESVEFVKGIPSVAYGDLTSGAVLIKTKAGYTPWNVKLKTDAQIKQVVIGKGFNLKSKGNINFNMDYLQSFDDLRSKYNGFNRITADFGFSKVFDLRKSVLTYHLKLNGYGTLDDARTDPDAMVEGENIKAENRGFRLNMYGKWSPGFRFLTHLDYSFSVATAHQISSEGRYRSSNGIQMVSTSMNEGENVGLFLPSEQLTHYTIDGKPVNAFLQLTVSKAFNFHGGIFNKVLYGFDYRFDANYGPGQIYDLANPPFVVNYKSRPRKFSDIPALKSLSFYLEDKFSAQMGKTVLDVQAGLRLNNFQPAGAFKSRLGFYAEPRLNAQYSFLSRKNNIVFDKMAIHAGIGKTYKSPPLLYLYPDKAYFDLAALSYYSGDPATSLSIIDTRIFDTSNPDLKPSENLKLEAGLNFKIRHINGTVTAFSERLSNGFDFTPVYLFLKYNKYLTDRIPLGTKPETRTLTKLPAVAPVVYLKPVNNQETQKTGVEFSFDFGKINTLYTTFSLDGAWLRTRHVYSTATYQFQPAGTNAVPFLYYGVYPADESKISERLNTNLRLVTQVPRLRMILSTTFQVLWYDSYYYPEYNKAPLYLVFADGSKKDFTPDMQTNPDYARFVTTRTPAYYLKEVMPVLLQTNFRLSKEIMDNLKLSVYVNNLFNYRPEYELIRAGSFIRRNPSLYFGAEIKIML